MRRLMGQWVEKDLLLVSKALNGKKKVMLFGRASYVMKRRLARSGFIWRQRERRWEKKIGRSKRLPPYLRRAT